MVVLYLQDLPPSAEPLHEVRVLAPHRQELHVVPANALEEAPHVGKPAVGPGVPGVLVVSEPR